MSQSGELPSVSPCRDTRKTSNKPGFWDTVGEIASALSGNLGAQSDLVARFVTKDDPCTHREENHLKQNRAFTEAERRYYEECRLEKDRANAGHRPDQVYGPNVKTIKQNGQSKHNGKFESEFFVGGGGGGNSGN